MSKDGGEQFAQHAAAVARDLFGEPNKALSSGSTLRFGKQGSLSVDTETGRFFDHESKEGGGVLWAIERQTGRPVEGGDAVEWMRENGYYIEDERPAAPPGGGPRLDPNGNWLPRRVPDHGRLTATFDYRDEKGELVYQVCRYDWTVDPEVNPKGHDKTFVQRRPDSSKKHGWNWSTRGVKALPYRLPELLEDAAQGYDIFLVEGEKKVDMLREIGVPATCNHGGAGKFPEELVGWFEDTSVVILPDNDEAGRSHADLAGRKLERVARRVRVLDIPGLPEKGGVDDWIPAGGDAEQLYELAQGARAFEARPFKSMFGAVEWLHLDDPGPVFDYLIKGVLTRSEQSMLLGESQSGKSFLAIDMAMAVARGIEWFGHKARKGGVVYQAGESAIGVRRRRLPAYRQHFDVAREPLPFVLLERPVDFYTSDEQVDQFIEECLHWGRTFPAPLELIVIDTFNKATPGANENDGKDMGLVLARCDRIREATGAHVMLVHHLNAGGTKHRGHTSLFANVENVVTCRKVPDAKDASNRQIREWVVSKQKDGEDGFGERFVLPAIEIARDGDGDAITSCIVAEPEGKAKPDNPDGIVVGGMNATVLRVIYDAISARGLLAPRALGLSRGALAIDRRALWEELRAKIDSEEDPDDDRESETGEDAAKRRNARLRKQVSRAIDFLFTRGVIGRRDGWIWLTGKRVRGFEAAPETGDTDASANSPPPGGDAEKAELPFDVEDFQ